MKAHARIRILVPIDFSASSRTALDAAIDLARKLDASLTVMQVWRITSLVAAGMDGDETDIVGLVEEVARGQLDDELVRIRQRCPRVDAVLRNGLEWKEILDVATTIGADLIVMGAHGRTGSRYAPLGSVAEAVVRTSAIPVFTVRLEKMAEKVRHAARAARAGSDRFVPPRRKAAAPRGSTTRQRTAQSVRARAALAFQRSR